MNLYWRTRLRHAARATWKGLARTGAAARYAYPVKNQIRIFTGYSYDIPKEEQLRSELFGALIRSRHFASQLEWNLYTRWADRAATDGEVDLALFRPGRIAGLLEIKRAWAGLPGWVAKPEELAALVQADVAKLQRASQTVARSGARVPFSAVIVGSFGGTFKDALGIADRILGKERQELYAGQTALTTFPFSSEQDRKSVYARFDAQVVARPYFPPPRP